MEAWVSSRVATCCSDARTTRWTWPSRATSRWVAAAPPTRGAPIARGRSRHLPSVVALAALVACSPAKPPSQAAAPAAPAASPAITRLPQVPYKIPLAYDEARAVLAAYQTDLPESLRDRDPAAQAAAWPGWVIEHDADIRARLAHGDEDSILN